MSKLTESFRLDDHHREILKMRSAATGMNQSEYIRWIIEQDNLGRFQKPPASDYDEWATIRSSIKLNDSVSSLLEAMKKEYDELEKNSGKKAKNLKTICEKYGLDYRIAKDDVKWLVKNDIFTKNSDADKKIYWTIQGVIVIPEYAPALSKKTDFVEGDRADVLCKFLGEYDEVIKFLNNALEITVKEAKSLFCFLLGHHIAFINFLREIAFACDGLANPEDKKYFRSQMLHFLHWFLLKNEDSPIFSKKLEENQMYKNIVKRINNYIMNEI